MGGPPRKRQSVPSEDVIDTHMLLDFLKSLPHTQGREHEGEPAAKRLQTTTSPIPYIPIGRQTFTAIVSSRRSARPTEQVKISRQNVEGQINLQLVSSQTVSISAPGKFHGKKIHALLDLPDARSDKKFCLFFPATERNRNCSSTPGHFWTSINILAETVGHTVTVTLGLELRWNESKVVSFELHKDRERRLRGQILSTYFPDVLQELRNDGDWTEEQSPQDFYEAVFIPNEESYPAASLEVSRLATKLYPFQKRAVHWLLEREGVPWSTQASLGTPRTVPVRRVGDAIPAHVKIAQDADNQPFYFSELYGIASRHSSTFTLSEKSVHGGILAEEMGLGKTVEIIALILMHKRPAETPIVFDNYIGSHVRPTGATLIITPPSLRNQWLSELNRHAPQLRVMIYTGVRSSCKDEASEAAVVEELAQHDVVITTYTELRSELHFALEPPPRNMRGERRHRRPKSPLVQLSWWRVCLDEAQEIESGVSNAATLARMIPRINAWGVTGTPVKDGVNDLRGLLLFLRYEPYASLPKVWQALIASHRTTFRELFGHIAIRHTKRLVRHELSLPSQKRFVITMPFTAVEEQHYQGLFKHLTEACGLDTEGVPFADDWDPDDPLILESMRIALNRLRQTALHPEVGARNRRALGYKSGPMRTVAEVLDAMIEQSHAALLSDKRALVSNKLLQGQLLENSPRVKEALAIWETVLQDINKHVQDCREALKIELDNATKPPLGRDKADSDEEDADTVPKRVGEAQRSLRYALELQHKAVFFCANAHFQIKSNEEMTKPESEDFKYREKLEIEAYERAKEIRREILQESHDRVTQHIQKVSDKAARQDFAIVPELRTLDRQGIESRRIVEMIDNINFALNGQADIIDEWREQIIQLLLKDLVDEDDDVEITGEEYGDSTQVQETLIAYITALRAVLADRQATLSGLALSQLSKDEIKGAVSLAKRGEGPVPEKVLELLAIREEIQPTSQLGSLRGAIAEFRDLSTSLRHQATNVNSRAAVELEIVTEQIKATQKQLAEQTKVATAMEQELDRFTSSMNARIDYYRQLQAVSDTVDPYEGPRDDTAVANIQREAEKLYQKLTSSESKHRYLLHLKENDSAEEQHMCVICQSSFTVGVLTVCGHQFCKECITLWFKAHHNCPVCKKKLQAGNLHDITLKPQELKIQTETSHTVNGSTRQDTPRTKKSSIYADFSADKLSEIKNIDLPGPSFTTKVDTLVRHMLWLRQTDPGAKSIIFSQYPEFLRVVAMAFDRHQIGFAAFAESDGIAKFTEDPGIECFLLHARAHSSGLNLVNASHVILCEPLLNTALELQAIARVDRIGQEHETTVWLYVVDGTVEQSIYDLSVRRRLEHMGRNLKGKSKESTPELLDSKLEVANALEMEEANLARLLSKGKLSGEEVPKGDLWECLFGSVSRSAASERVELRENPEVQRFLVGEAAGARRAGTS